MSRKQLFSDTFMMPFDFYIKENETSAFLRHYVASSIGSIRLAIWIAILVVSAFAILDIHIAPHVATKIMILRFAVIVPLLFVAYAVTFLPSFIRLSQLILFLLGLFVGFAFVYLNYLIPLSEIAAYFCFTNIVFWVMWVHTLLRLKAELAMIVSGFSIIAFNVQALLLRPLPGETLMFDAIMYIDAVLMSIYLLGIWTSNQTELLLWRDFEQVSIIRHEKKAIEESQKQLLELNRLKGKLLSIISHDIRGPISSIHGILSLYHEKHISADELKQSLLKLNKAIGSTSHLIDNLLSWSLAQLESREILKKNVSFRAMVDNVFEVVRTQAELKNTRLVNSIDPAFNGMVEPTMIELVIRNLVSNSIKFTDGGTIEVTAAKHHGTIRISVEDSGSGISKEVASNLFNWNERNSTDGTRSEKGAGLGLLICKEFIEKHGGTLSFDADRNIGATFHFTLNESISI